MSHAQPTDMDIDSMPGSGNASDGRSQSNQGSPQLLEALSSVNGGALPEVPGRMNLLRMDTQANFGSHMTAPMRATQHQQNNGFVFNQSTTAGPIVRNPAPIAPMFPPMLSPFHNSRVHSHTQFQNSENSYHRGNLPYPLYLHFLKNFD